MKQKRKLWKKGIVCGAIVCVGAVAGTLALKSSATEDTDTSYVDTTVKKGTIQSSISGTGSISYSDSTTITLPSDLEIKELLVSEGSSVTAGTMLATVDEASLAFALAEVTDAISETDSTITEEKNNSTSQSIKAGVSGRVKKIYAEKDDSVVSVMRDQGALMVISTDGLMKVTLEAAGNVKAGDSVKVKNDTTETTGTVRSVDATGTVITFSDSVFDYEEEVSVTDEDGIALGKGCAMISEPLSVIGIGGTITSVNVSINDSVSASTKVYTLDSDLKSADYSQAVKEREQLVNLLNTLLSIQTNGGIVAESDGIVETINVSATNRSSGNEETDGSMVMGDHTEGDVLLSEQYEKDTTPETDSAVMETGSADTETDSEQNKTATVAGTTNANRNEQTVSVVTTNQKGMNSSMKQSGFMTMSTAQNQTAAVSERSTQTNISVEAPKNLTAGNREIIGTTSAMEYADSENATVWQTCQDGSTKVAAGIWYVRYKETDVAKASASVRVVISEGTSEDQSDAKENGAVTPQDDKADKTESDTKNLQDELEDANRTNGNNTNEDNTTSQENSVPNAQNKTDSDMPDAAATTGNQNTGNEGSTGRGSNDGKSATASAVSSLSGGSSTSTSSNTSISSVSTVEGFVIASGDRMKVTMSVDEMDILSMEEGMTAEITLDAIEGKTFEGEITAISGSTSSSGGTAKYPVEITFDKTENMLEGMNASVEVITQKTENVLVVPLLAVVDEGRTSYVYTGYDASTKELTGKTEVTLGASDGTQAEVVSGLSEGDTICYEIIGNTSPKENGRTGMGDFDMPGGGMDRDGMPSDHQWGGQREGGRPGEN